MALSGTDPLVWRTNLDDVSDPFVAVDQDGAIVEFNRAAEQLFGHSRDEAVGRGSSLLLPEHDREANPTGLLGLLGGGAGDVLGRRASAAVSRGDGSETVAEFAVTHLSDSPRLIGAVVRAPAAEPHAEERLWEQAELLRVAEESAALGTWHWDIAEGVLVWSSEMYAIHGVTGGWIRAHLRVRAGAGGAC